MTKLPLLVLKKIRLAIISHKIHLSNKKLPSPPSLASPR